MYEINPSYLPPDRVHGTEDATTIAREELMTKFSITYNGRYYQFQRYRYDCLEDAVNYARLRRSEPAAAETIDVAASAEPIAAPTEAQLEVIAPLGITFQRGIYHLRHYRYDHLVDAVNYARRRSP